MKFWLSLAIPGLLWCAEAFVPVDFTVPTSYMGKAYKLVPLGPDVVKQDYDAYMSSIDHLKKNFSSGNWPHAGITMADAMKDMEGEIASFGARKSFAYAVLTPDGSKELGCFYLRPSPKQGYDAVASLWVTKDQYDKGFEPVLLKDMRAWTASAWPFKKIAWPRRDIPLESWNSLPAKAR